MAPGSARIGRIVLPISNTIERHGGASSKNHTEKDADEIKDAKWLALPREQRAHQCKRERKDGVAKANHFQDHSKSSKHGILIIEEERGFQQSAACLKKLSQSGPDPVTIISRPIATQTHQATKP